MFDIIGYWSAVTFLVGSTILIPLMYIYPLLSIVLASSIPNEEDAEKLRHFLFSCRGRHDIVHIFGKSTEVADVLWFMAIPGGLLITLMFMGLALNGAVLSNLSVVELYSLWAMELTPLFKFVGSAAIGVLLFRSAVKYLYYAVKFKEKVEAHVSDKSIHN